MYRIKTDRVKENAAFYSNLTHSNWSSIIQPSGTGVEYWNKLFQYFPEHQLFYETTDGEWLGFANTIPIYYDEPIENLPDEGWDWLIEKGIKGFENKISPNTLGGLQIGVNPLFRGHSWSKKILEKAKISMHHYGFKKFVLPIRPTFKHKHPEIPMEEYLTWKKEGIVYDPWIRTHLNAGAKIIKVCHKAMTVKGTVQEWEKWADKNFNTSGDYVVEGGLSLVKINLEKNIGVYLEPNIWIYYD